MDTSAAQASSQSRPCPFADPKFRGCGQTMLNTKFVCEKCEKVHPYWLRKSANGNKELLELVKDWREQKMLDLDYDQYLCPSQSPTFNNKSSLLALVPYEPDCSLVDSPDILCPSCIQKAKDIDLCDSSGRVKHMCIMSDPKYKYFPFRQHWSGAVDCEKTTKEDSMCEKCWIKIEKECREKQDGRLRIYCESRGENRGSLRKNEDGSLVVKPGHPELNDDKRVNAATSVMGLRWEDRSSGGGI